MNHNPYPFSVFGGPDDDEVSFNDDTPQSLFDVANVIEELALMDAEEIRNKLINLGIKGEQSVDNSCPLAVYLEEELGLDDAFLSVDSAHINVDVEGYEYTFFLANYSAKNNIGDFVVLFDNGEYPELIQGSET